MTNFSYFQTLSLDNTLVASLIDMDGETDLQSFIVMLFQQEELGTWILPDDALVVEGNTISVTDQAQSFPVCALSSGNLRKGLLTYCKFLIMVNVRNYRKSGVFLCVTKFA